MLKLNFPGFDETRLVLGISERGEGDMRVAKGADLEKASVNRERFFGRPEFQSFKVAAALLEHGKEVAWVEDAGYFSGDGLITSKHGVLLTVTVADCVPVFLYSASSDSIGIMHAGWKGLSLGAVRSIVEAMGTVNTAYIGPHICAKHYESDLEKQVREQLLVVPVSSVHSASICTYENKEKFFSYRRDRPAVPEAMVAYIGIR